MSKKEFLYSYTSKWRNKSCEPSKRRPLCISKIIVLSNEITKTRNEIKLSTDSNL